MEGVKNERVTFNPNMKILYINISYIMSEQLFDNSYDLLTYAVVNLIGEMQEVKYMVNDLNERLSYHEMHHLAQPHWYLGTEEKVSPIPDNESKKRACVHFYTGDGMKEFEVPCEESTAIALERDFEQVGAKV